MTDQNWTPLIGLRKATLSLLWRTPLAAAIWYGALWGFDVVLSGIGITAVPVLIVIGFSALLGTIVGFLMSRGLSEQAGFVSPLLTLLAATFAAVAIIGGEAIFNSLRSVATAHLRYGIVGTAMVVTVVWIVKNTMFDD